LRIALVGALQWLLWGQAQIGQQSADGSEPQADSEFLLDQRGRNLAGPQPEVQAVLPGVFAVDPAKHLRLLRGRELGGASRRRASGQRALSFASTRRSFQPAVDRRAIHPQRLHHFGRLLAFPDPTQCK
jgi:hypothetical protein